MMIKVSADDCPLLLAVDDAVVHQPDPILQPGYLCFSSRCEASMSVCVMSPDTGHLSWLWWRVHMGCNCTGVYAPLVILCSEFLVVFFYLKKCRTYIKKTRVFYVNVHHVYFLSASLSSRQDRWYLISSLGNATTDLVQREFRLWKSVCVQTHFLKGGCMFPFPFDWKGELSALIVELRIGRWVSYLFQIADLSWTKWKAFISEGCKRPKRVATPSF